MLTGLLLFGCGGAACPTTIEIVNELNTPLLSTDTGGPPVQPLGPKSIRAEARVEQWGDGQRIRGTVMMFAKREDLLRFDVMTQFGPASTMTSQNGSFSLWDQRESAFFVGEACATNIERLSGLPLNAQEVVALLYADAHALRTSADNALEFVKQTCDDGTVTLKFARGGVQREELYARPEAHAPLKVVAIRERGLDEEIIWSVTFDDYEKNGAYWLPMDIRYVMKSRSIDTTIRFKEIAVDVDVPDGAFSQQTPPGLTPQRMSCGL